MQLYQLNQQEASGWFPVSWLFCTKWPKYWNFSFNYSPSNEYSGLMSLRIDWFDLLAGQGTPKTVSSTTIQKHQFSRAQPLWSSAHIRPCVCIVAQSCRPFATPWTVVHHVSLHWDSPGKNSAVGCHALLQGIFPSQIEPRSPTLQTGSLPSEPPAKPHIRKRLLEKL